MMGDCDLALNNLNLLMKVKPNHKEGLEIQASIQSCAQSVAQAENYLKHNNYYAAKQALTSVVEVPVHASINHL